MNRGVFRGDTSLVTLLLELHQDARQRVSDTCRKQIQMMRSGADPEALAIGPS